LLVVNNAAAPVLYRNDGGNANDYLRIKPRGTLSNRDGIGVWITVTPDLTDPNYQLVWEIDGGSSFVSQSERVAHFGLGPSADLIDLSRIEWPASGIVQELRNVAPNQLLSVVERHPGDFNSDGLIDAADYVVWRDTIGMNVKHGTGADANGNGIIDAADNVIWKAHFGATWRVGFENSGPLTSAGQSLPEPTSCTLAVVSLLCWTGVSARQRIGTKFDRFVENTRPRWVE
jgi:ASPIC and UnbV